MRAAVVTRFGAPDVIELSAIPDPIPGSGEVSIDVSYAAVGLVEDRPPGRAGQRHRAAIRAPHLP